MLDAGYSLLITDCCIKPVLTILECLIYFRCKNIEAYRPEILTRERRYWLETTVRISWVTKSK